MRSLGLVIAGFGVALVGASPALAASATAAKPPAATQPKVLPTGVDPAALQALRRMSSFLATLPAVELTSNSSVDVVTNYGQRVQLEAVVNYRIRRPNAFVINVVSDKKKRTFFYDGKNFTVYSPQLGYYATVAAPATIRETLASIESKFGIELPLEDLFRWNDPTNSPADNLISGFVVGTATIDGVETDTYAFRQAHTDWQIWIKRGDQPLPVKVMIVDQVDPANPTYIARLSWNLNPTLTDNDFTFQPGADAKPIRLSELAK